MALVYQPVLIRALVDTGGTATIGQLAPAFLLRDEAELQRCEQTIRKMPGRCALKKARHLRAMKTSFA